MMYSIHILGLGTATGVTSGMTLFVCNSARGGGTPIGIHTRDWFMSTFYSDSQDASGCRVPSQCHSSSYMILIFISPTRYSCNCYDDQLITLFCSLHQNGSCTWRLAILLCFLYYPCLIKAWFYSPRSTLQNLV